MGKIHKPRAGSLQFWPRKKSARPVPSINWEPIEKKYSDKKLLGFIGYKAGMLRVIARDITADSQVKNKQILIPATLIEVPPVKILSARFYKKIGGAWKVETEVLAPNLDKELKRKIKLSKKQFSLDEVEKRLDNFQEIRVIVYSVVKKTKKKKTPEILEISIGGSVKEKFDFIKNNFGKELEFKEFFSNENIIDVRGLTRGRGFTGPVKRFGIGLRSHKSEKGIRRPGSLGPWHPARVTFRAPMAGQFGLFKRTHYNQKILHVGNTEELKGFNFQHYGNVNTNYVLVKGSVQGPAKRTIVLTLPLRETKRTKKQNYEFIKIIK